MVFYESIKVGDVSVATPIVGSKTIIVSILSVILGIEKLNFLLLAAVLLATIGFISITLHIRKLDKFQKKDLIKCVAFALATSLCWSVADILVKKIKYIHAFTITFGSLSFAFLLYFAFIFYFKKNQMVFSMPSFDKKRYFFYGVFSLALTYLLLNLSLVKIGIIKTNIIISLWPLIASLVGYSHYKEKLFFSKMFGAIMLAISFVLVILG